MPARGGVCLPAAAYLLAAASWWRICLPEEVFCFERKTRASRCVCVCVSITIIIITVILWLKWLESFGFKLGVLRSIGTSHA